jgi:hypothetical protein
MGEVGRVVVHKEVLGLWLLAYSVGYSLGLVKGEAVSKEELQAKLEKSAKIASTRLGRGVALDKVQT